MHKVKNAFVYLNFRSCRDMTVQHSCCLWLQEKQTQCLTTIMVSVSVYPVLVSNKYTAYSFLFLTFSNTCKVWETSGCGMNDVFEDSKDTSGLSEHELLDIVYDTCNSSKSGTQMDWISFRQKNGAVMVWRLFHFLLFPSCLQEKC